MFLILQKMMKGRPHLMETLLLIFDAIEIHNDFYGRDRDVHYLAHACGDKLVACLHVDLRRFMILR